MAVSDNSAQSPPREAVAAEAFKLGMRRLVASVCLITAGEVGSRVGMTATAVCSVSADPPTLLCCVNRSSASYPTIVQAGSFAVNVLTTSDLYLADRFSSKLSSEEKFDLGEWRQSFSPILDSALASFDCQIAHHIEVESHGILLGKVCMIDFKSEDGSPLLYAHGRYAAVAQQ